MGFSLCHWLTFVLVARRSVDVTDHHIPRHILYLLLSWDRTGMCCGCAQCFHCIALICSTVHTSLLVPFIFFLFATVHLLLMFIYSHAYRTTRKYFASTRHTEFGQSYQGCLCGFGFCSRFVDTLTKTRPDHCTCTMLASTSLLCLLYCSRRWLLKWKVRVDVKLVQLRYSRLIRLLLSYLGLNSFCWLRLSFFHPTNRCNSSTGSLGLYNPYFFAWIFVGVLSAIYSFAWDVLHDWGLFQKNNQHKYLRKKITYSPAVCGSGCPLSRQ